MLSFLDTSANSAGQPLVHVGGRNPPRRAQPCRNDVASAATEQSRWSKQKRTRAKQAVTEPQFEFV